MYGASNVLSLTHACVHMHYTLNSVLTVHTFTAEVCPVSWLTGSLEAGKFHMNVSLSLPPLARNLPSLAHFSPHTSIL